MSKVEDGTKILNSVEQLEKELTNAAETLLPLMNAYLKDVRNVRMSFATETQHIISHINQFRQLTDLTKPLGELVVVISQLSKLMTPEMTMLLKKVSEIEK